MPKRPNNKKKNRRNQNEKLTSCEGCAKELTQDENTTCTFLYCKCTTVRFCCEQCQLDNPHKDCPGIPGNRVDIGQTLREYSEQGSIGWRSPDVKANQDKENRDTVQNPSMSYIMQSRNINLNNNNMTAWDYAKLADEGNELGNQACAYLAGSRFKHRLLSAVNPSSRVSHNNTRDNIPILESEELAFKYYEKAAKLGHGLAMQSLGECFDNGIGCNANRRRCNHWLWRSCLDGSYGAIEMLDSRALLPLEINANIQMIDSNLHRILPGQTLALSGPNLASLLLVMNHTVKRENFSMSPFAGTWPTATVNNKLTIAGRCESNHRIPLIGSGALKEVMKCLNQLHSRGNPTACCYGRRGVAKEATAQIHDAASRPIENQLFLVPPTAACDERATDEDRTQYEGMIYELNYDDSESAIECRCVHTEKYEGREGQFVCKECEMEAMGRLDAVSNGSVVLSLEEGLSQRGHGAIYRSKLDGSLKMETWKMYCGGEAECVLAILAASGVKPYCMPLFIAQDPNFYWPLIADHGCIRAALEFVAPHIDWDEKNGTVKEKIHEQVPIVKGSRPGKCLRKCGSTFCTVLEKYTENGFKLCARCNRRWYCSARCQKADWPQHKHECVPGPREEEVDLHLDIPEDEDDIKESSKKYDLDIRLGEDVIVHDLKAKPEYNGLVGIIGETGTNGRIALTLRSEIANKIISIKPDNIYCLGVFSRSRRKKSRVFECVHGMKVCAKCYFDFSVVNELAKLKYSGQDITNSFVVDQVNQTYYSSIELDDCENAEDCYSVQGFPLECQYGMNHHLKERYILKALMETKVEISLLAAVARAAYVTYGGLEYPVLRPNKNLETVAKML
jgi:hypothetical protein